MSPVVRRLVLAIPTVGVLASIVLLNKGLQGDVRLGQLAVVLFLACICGFAALARRRR